MGAAVALGLIRYSSNTTREFESKSSKEDFPRPKASLGGVLYLEKAQRLAIYWKNGDFELWDTEHGHRLDRVERLPRRVGWCVASPDEATILTADSMVDIYNSVDRHLWWKRFVPSIRIWDAKTGERTHTIQVPEAAGYPAYIHEWYARWLDNSRALLVRLQRENPARGACETRLIVLDTAAGQVVQSSKEFVSLGEHVYLSPDKKMAIVQADNYWRRPKDGSGIAGSYRNMYASTYVVNLENLTVASSWREPRHPKDPDWQTNFALIARWCPDGKAVLTVDTSWADDHPAPKIRSWDARSGRLLQTFSGHNDHILDLAFTARGDKLLSASEDRTVRVWDMRSGAVETVFSGHSAGLNKVIVLPGDKLAVSAAEEPSVKVWDLATGKLLFDLPDHDSEVRDVEVVSDQVVRTVTKKGTSTLWNCSNGKKLETTPKLFLDFPKQFGVCELVLHGDLLQMRILDQQQNKSLESR